MNNLSSKTLKIVVDPTVLIGALLDPRGGCATLLDHISKRSVELVLDEPVRASLAASLEDPDAQDQGRWSGADALRWMNALEILATVDDSPVGALTQESSSASKDFAATMTADRHFFALAERSGAVLVTSDSETLAHSGTLGVDVVRPETINEVLSARAW